MLILIFFSELKSFANNFIPSVNDA